MVKILFQCWISLSEFWKSGAWYDLKSDTLIDRGFTLILLVSIMGGYINVVIRILKFNKMWFGDMKPMDDSDFKKEDYLNTFFLNKNFNSISKNKELAIPYINFLNVLDKLKIILIMITVVYA